MPALAPLKPSPRLISPSFLATILNLILILFEHRLTTSAGLVRDDAFFTPNLPSCYSPCTAEYVLTLPCFFILDIESNINHIEYDMDDEDEAWLARLEREHRLSINSDDFEYLIDFLEKQEYLYPMIKLNLDKAIKEVRPDLQPALRFVHDYWRQRIAERGGRPLLRRFLNHGAEKQPFAAFGVKMIPPPTQQKKRAPIEDERAYARLCYVQAQFVQARLLLARILQREELKREKVRLTQTVLELLVHHKHGGGHGNSAGSGLLATAPFASPSNGSFVHPNSLSTHALAQSIPAAAAYAAQLAEAQAAPPAPTYPPFTAPGAVAPTMGPNGPVAAMPHQAAGPASHPHHNNVQSSTSHMQGQHPGLQHPLPGKRPPPGVSPIAVTSSTSPHSTAGSSALAGGAAAMAGTSTSPISVGAKATGTPRGRIVLKASAATVAARAAQQQQAQSPGSTTSLPSPHHMNGNAMTTHPNGAMMMVAPGGVASPMMAQSQHGYLASPRGPAAVVSPHHNHLAVSGGQHPVSSPRVHSPYGPVPTAAAATAAGYASPRSPLPQGYQPPTKITAAASPRNVLAVSGSAPAPSGSPRPSVHVMGPHHPTAAPATAAPYIPTQPIEVVDEDRGNKLEGEFALNPDNLLRGYPFIGGMKKPSEPNKGANGKRKSTLSSSPPARQPHIGLTNAAMAAANAAANAKKAAPSLPSPFSSKQFSPFFDPLTGTRYDEYTVHDEDIMTMEELELECEEEEEDALISNLEQTIASSALPASYQALLQPNRGDTDALMYKQGFAAQDVEYNPTDTLLQWNKSDLSYLRKEWLESADNPYNLPSFTSALPNPTTTLKGADSSSQQSSSVTHRHPHPNTPAASSTQPPQHVSPHQFRLPVVEPLMLPATLPGYHVYSVRPAMSGPLPPRRYQVKTTITPNTVNGLPYATWLNGAQMPVGLLSTVPEKAFHHPLPKHDDFAPSTETSNQYRGFENGGNDSYEAPHAKRFKLANGEMGFDLVDAETFSEALPETMFLTAENSSYNLIDLERDGLRAVRARKRIDRYGRVVWDTIPNSYFDEVEKDEKAREDVRNRILAERAAVIAASRALEPPIESELNQASNGSSSSSASSSSPTYDGSYPSNNHSSASSTTTAGRPLSVGTAASSQSGSDFDLSSIMANSMNSTVSSEPNSLDAVSGETTIANGSCSHSPYETSPNSGHSPMSGKIPILENPSNPIYPMSAPQQQAVPTNGAVVQKTFHAPPPMNRSMPPAPQQRNVHQQQQSQAVDESPYNPLVVHLHQRHHMPAAALPKGQDLIIHDPHADVLNTSHMMMDVPLTDNLEDMPWL